MGKSAAEKLLNELRRVKSNKKCADCETKSRFGFSHVCVKYNIFVCPKCKSAHQAYSHRVKVRLYHTHSFFCRNFDERSVSERFRQDLVVRYLFCDRMNEYKVMTPHHVIIIIIIIIVTCPTHPLNLLKNRFRPISRSGTHSIEEE